MLSKPQYLYQTKLIIDCFPKEDYESIPKETLKYIEDNMQVDSNIVINPDISLEEQDIDPQTWQLLQKIADDVSDREFYEEYKKDVDEYINIINEQNDGFKARIDNINLSKDCLKLQKENLKLPKAKELRRVAKPLITRAKEDSVHNRRIAFSRLRDKEIVGKLFTDIGPRFKERQGGYLRIIKCGFRAGDNAPMAYVALVDEADAGQQAAAE